MKFESSKAKELYEKALELENEINKLENEQKQCDELKIKMNNLIHEANIEEEKYREELLKKMKEFKEILNKKKQSEGIDSKDSEKILVMIGSGENSIFVEVKKGEPYMLADGTILIAGQSLEDEIEKQVPEEKNFKEEDVYKAYKKGDSIKVKFDIEGNVIYAKGFGLILWTNNINIDNEIIGKNIAELLEIIKNNSDKDNFKEFYEGVYKDFHKKNIKNFIKKIVKRKNNNKKN